MNRKWNIRPFAGAFAATAAAVLTTITMPTAAFAQDHRDRDDWRDRHDNGNHYGQWKHNENRDRDDRDQWRAHSRDQDRDRDRDRNADWNHRDRDNWRQDRNDRNDRNDQRGHWVRNPFMQNGGSWSRNSYNQDPHRQQTKNQWRNIALGAGGVAALGLIQHNPAITFAGAAGALYSLNRYEQDRKSQSDDSRVRAAFFSQPYFYRDGVRYDRHEVTRNGQRYYQFVRH